MLVRLQESRDWAFYEYTFQYDLFLYEVYECSII
jgi:hypothetical protein